MFCDAATVAYRVQGADSVTGRPYKPYAFFRYTSDEDLYRRYNEVPAGSEALLLPCGKCMLCTRRYRLGWVLRCVHELHYYNEACYLTLTVDDAHIDKLFPPMGRAYTSDLTWHSLRHEPFQKFMKRLRIRLQRGFAVMTPEYCADQPLTPPIYRKIDYHGEPGKSLRYYMCGEYGDNTHRPHYHAILFGFYPPDALPLPGTKLQVSNLLSQVWPYGYHTVAHVEPDCVSYVAGYVDKKMDSNRMAWANNNVAPEYTCMSRRGGIGLQFFHDFLSDIYPQNDDGSLARDYCIIGRGARVKVPRYYDQLLELHLPYKYANLVAHRAEVAAQRGAIDLADWLNESHRRNAVAVARRRQRDPGVAMPG